MSTKVTYEWKYELVDECGDIVDTDHSEALRTLLRRHLSAPAFDDVHYCLVRDVHCNVSGNLIRRGHAYILPGGELESTFDCGQPVPQAFIIEAERCQCDLSGEQLKQEEGRPTVIDKHTAKGACETVALVHDLTTGNVEKHDNLSHVGTAGKAVGSERFYVPVPERIYTGDLGQLTHNLKRLQNYIEDFIPEHGGDWVICGVSRRGSGAFYVGDDGKLFWGVTPDASAKMFGSADDAHKFLSKGIGWAIAEKLQSDLTVGWAVVRFKEVEEFVHRMREKPCSMGSDYCDRCYNKLYPATQ